MFVAFVGECSRVRKSRLQRGAENAVLWSLVLALREITGVAQERRTVVQSKAEQS
jgi:hypothetical protein